MAVSDVTITGKQTVIAMLAVSMLAGGLGALFAPSPDQKEARTQPQVIEEAMGTRVFEQSL